MLKDYLGIKVHTQDPPFISELGRAILSDGYVKENETIPEAFARASTAFCGGDYALAQRIYDAVYNNHFMFATPIITNAPKGVFVNGEFVAETEPKGLPISCYGMMIPDTVDGQIKAMQELAALSVSGGGVGLHSDIRATSQKAPGPIPYAKVLDSTIGYFKQSGARRGAVSLNMRVDHPDIIEHIRFRQPGGDPKRRSDNRQQFHTTVLLTDAFVEAVNNDTEYELVCPKKGVVYETINARTVWEEILESRALTGEPCLVKIDQANKHLPVVQQEKGLKINGSNICLEILLPTDEQRTFVCCLSSLNVEKFEGWKDTSLVADLVVFLDNVLSYFIKHCPPILEKAKYAAMMERAIGIGTFGLHSFLQSKSIPFESGGFNSAVQWNNIIYKTIKEQAVSASKALAKERGEAPDMVGTGMRNSRLLAIAPNASSGDIANSSPSIEPWYRNVFVKDTRVGSVLQKNPHLEKVLESHGKNTDEVWQDIKNHDGSVQHIEWLDEHTKSVFKTAMEIDQHWLVELANVRGKYICQAQSLNLFFPAGSSRKYVNSVHRKWAKSENVHTLYYYRTEKESSVKRAEEIERKALVDWNSDECVACSG